MTVETDKLPRRNLDKQEAIRHLIHTAIRLIMDMEDPFAVHVLVHSADKLLIDVAKANGRKLRFDWEDYIKPEYRKEFFERYRATYNYFKHADKDFDNDLPVHDITRVNVLNLYMCIANYVELFSETTTHMTFHIVFTLTMSPQFLEPPETHGTGLGAQLLKAMQTSIENINGLTPKDIFDEIKENMHKFPQFYVESASDRKDTVHFYNLSFSELRAGTTKSDRILRVPGL